MKNKYAKGADRVDPKYIKGKKDMRDDILRMIKKRMKGDNVLEMHVAKKIYDDISDDHGCLNDPLMDDTTTEASTGGIYIKMDELYVKEFIDMINNFSNPSQSFVRIKDELEELMNE